MNSIWTQGRIALSALSLGIISVLPSPCWADNPIVQTYYTADPAPMVHEGRLYLYTSHDEDVTVNDFYTMNDWRLYSTVDMVNWTDHGSVGGYKTFSWGTDNAWAPQGVARNGKFYLYVPLNNNTGAKIGVGVADTPAGPFKDPIGKELVSNGSMAIDPTVFVDDDGQAHLYWGNGNLRYVKLNSDMISTSGSVTSNIALTGFTEGPWFYKRGSIYYMVYAAGSGNEKISYATASAPAGPWTYKGDVMAAGSIFTNHPGIVDYKGHSYFFYHNGALPGGGTYKRSVCVEEFTYGEDGSIPKIAMTTQGPAAVETLNPFQQVEAETIAFSKGLKTEACSDTGAGMNVMSISNGDYIKVKDVDFGDGVTSFEARVSSSGSGAKIELHLDSETGTLLGTCDVSGASSWTTKTCEVSGGSGKHDLFLKFVGGSGDLFKFNWWKFTGPNTNQGTGGAGSGGASAAAGSGTRSPTSTAGGTSSVQSRSGSSATGRGGSGPGSNSGRDDGSGGSSQTTGASSVSTGKSTASAGGSRATNQPGDSTEVSRGGSVASGTKGTAQASGATAVSAAAESSNPDGGACSCRAAGSRGPLGLGAIWLAASVLLLRRRAACKGSSLLPLDSTQDRGH